MLPFNLQLSVTMKKTFVTGLPEVIAALNLGKRGFVHVESWRLAWDGKKGSFCSKYREYLQENQRSRPSQSQVITNRAE